MSAGGLDKFGVDPIVGIVVSNINPITKAVDPLGRCDIVVAEYGPKPLQAIPPLWPVGLESTPDIDDPVRLLEFPGGQMFYVALNPTKGCTTDAAVLYAPLKAVLLAILDDLDKIKTHTHDAGEKLMAPSGTAGGPCTGYTGAPVEDLDYGDARKDIEDDKPKSLKVRIVTKVPHGGNG